MRAWVFHAKRLARERVYPEALAKHHLMVGGRVGRHMTRSGVLDRLV
jgi:hypothetical protein